MIELAAVSAAPPAPVIPVNFSLAAARAEDASWSAIVVKVD